MAGESNLPIQYDAWIQQLDAEIAEVFPVLERRHSVQSALDEMFLALDVMKQNKLPTVKIAGSSDWVGYSLPWPAFSPKRIGCVEIYKQLDDNNDTYELTYFECEQLEPGDPSTNVAVASDSFLVTFPHLTERLFQTATTVEARIQRPLRFSKTAVDEQPEALWESLHNILNLS